MPIPHRRNDLQSFGYVFQDRAYCSGCDAPIEWWSTPKGKKMPFDVTESETGDVLLPHWDSCPVADRFRRKP